MLRCLGSEARTVDDLARLVAADEGTASGRSAGPSRLLHVRTSLEHQHLPKLAHAGLVEWNRSENRVRRTAAAEAVDPLLRFVAPDGRSEAVHDPTDA